jgi:DNA invertase Pin-like site-specific DNA recombinase
MSQWWVNKQSREPGFDPQQSAVAYYRHSAQDKQENSISIQQEQVQAWAAKNGLTIIKEFLEPGKSGLTAEGRPAFMDLMENWVKKRNDFKYIICLDVSRWGRFPDIDLSATYSAECKLHGKIVVYTDIGKPKDDDPIYPVYVQFERYRAAQYSRELSGKVWRGCVKIAEQGYWAGGKPPYGFERMLLNEARQPVQKLSPGERKSIQNQRVVLVLGSNDEITVIRRIFTEFVNHDLQEHEIALSLNNDHILSPGERQWDCDKVRNILGNELYTGTMVYNKTSKKLKGPSISNPRERWIRSPNAFVPIIDKDTFLRAQEIFADRIRRYTSESMLQRLKEILNEYGFLRPSLLRGDRFSPSPTTYTTRFGSFDGACQSIYSDSLAKAYDNVLLKITEQVNLVEQYDNFIVIDNRFTVLIQPSVPLLRGYSQYWYFKPDQRNTVDITLGVPISAEPPHDILGYFVFPRVLMRNRSIRLFASSECYMDVYGSQDLAFMQQLIK